jgi:dolichyl-phosphate-mannose-protein mannosyltransferase
LLYAFTKSTTQNKWCEWTFSNIQGFHVTPLSRFDEVHFGKFASFYISREYYFDVHPPFAKLLFGLAGWFVGFDGRFTFENIGDSYTDAHVPYVGMRALPAILGSLTIPVVYFIMKETGYSTIIAAFSASIILFGMLTFDDDRQCFAHRELDNAHIAQSRLILLDAALIFFMSLTIYAYIRFRKLRYLYVQVHNLSSAYSCHHRSYTSQWWIWLLLTGAFMACTWGSKVNGILTVFTIGIAVLIDLWDMLDMRKGHSLASHNAAHLYSFSDGLSLRNILASNLLRGVSG